MHLTAPVRVAIVALTSIAGSMAHAGVLVVDAAGGGSFTQISAAVAAASDGDVLLVKSGSYSGFALGTKALDIVADVGADVFVQGQVSVSGLAVTRGVTLNGLQIRATSYTPALRLDASTGSIRVQGCTLHGFDQPDCTGTFIPGGHAAVLLDCTDVAFANCTLIGGDGADFGGSYGYEGGAGLLGTTSRVALYDCTLRGGAGGNASTTCYAFPGGYAGDGGGGLWVQATPLSFFSNASATGGTAGVNPPGAGFDGCHGAGLSVYPYANPTPSIAIALQSTFVAGPGPSVCSVPIGDIVVAPGATFTTLTGNARRMVARRVVREQQPARIDFFGQPGDEVRLVIGEAPRFLYSSAWSGVSLVRHPHPTPVQIVGTIGPSGTLNESWLVPDLGPGVQSRRFFLQAQFIDPSGRATLGTPATLVLLDSAF